MDVFAPIVFGGPALTGARAVRIVVKTHAEAGVEQGTPPALSSEILPQETEPEI